MGKFYNTPYALKRLLFIDQLRALAIYLIIFGHNDYTSEFGVYLSSFRLPLFFIISGLIGKDKSGVTLGQFISKYTKRLLVPYFSISVLLYVFWLFVGRNFGESVTQNYDPIKNLIGILYAQGGPEYMNWGIPMWFLPALFMVLLLDFFVAKLPFKFQLVPAILIPIAGLYTYKLLDFHLPWSFDVAMVVYGFYFFGRLLRKVDFVTYLSGWQKPLALFVVFFVLHFIGTGYNGRVLFYYGDYGNVPLMYLNGLTGFVWAFCLFKILPTHSFLVWIGRNTLPILALHLPALSVIKGIMLFVFGVELQFNLWLSLAYGIVQIVLLVPVILIINRHFPFLVGNPWRINSAKSR